jgi:hypothetical protein
MKNEHPIAEQALSALFVFVSLSIVIWGFRQSFLLGAPLLAAFIAVCAWFLLRKREGNDL